MDLRKLFLTLFFVISICFSHVYKIPSSDDVNAFYVDNGSAYNVLVVCSIHGNEPLGSRVIGKILSDKVDLLPSNLNYCIILEPSKYRIQRNRRTNFEGFDPNRTFINLFSNSAKFIVSMINKYDPILLLDIHQAKRENIDFMYSFGSFCRTMGSIYRQDEVFGISRDTIYTSDYYVLSDLQKDLENKSIELFKKKVPRVEKYTALNREDSYDSISVLRNFAASKGVFSVLFEIPYYKGNDKNLEIVFLDYLSFVSKEKENFKKYKDLAKKIQERYFKSRFFLIPTNFENFNTSFFTTFGINYYKTKIENKVVLGFDIQKISIISKDEFKNFLYLDIDVKVNSVRFDQEDFYLIKADVLSSFVFNPIYRESVWNFFAIPFSIKFVPVYIYEQE